MRDPYQTLGVDRGASAEDVKRAYRRLAAQHHPDRGGDTARFQEIQQAYDAITNPRPDQAQPQPGTNPFGPGGFGFGFAFDDFFNMFQQQTQQRRNHVRMTLWIDLRDVAQGGRRTVSLGTHLGVQNVEIEVPRGINDGDAVQYTGLGPNGMDLVVEYRIRPDNTWQRQGLNVMCERNLVIWDLILGVQLQLTDLLGQRLEAQVPPMTQPGTMLRLRGRGLNDRTGNVGDCLIRINTELPIHIDPALIEAIQKYR
jgi:curved DNA-binding protein